MSAATGPVRLNQSHLKVLTCQCRGQDLLTVVVMNHSLFKFEGLQCRTDQRNSRDTVQHSSYEQTRIYYKIYFNGCADISTSFLIGVQNSQNPQKERKYPNPFRMWRLLRTRILVYVLHSHHRTHIMCIEITCVLSQYSLP